ncbi:DUF2076 domain-containing protein [Komagataeibacter oboediens]|uniref:ABC transporter substrate-binding protein n=1 Tax=Komagataeibacter oboediens TaxID=65958 RepID=A0A318R0U6_9PROT|nr:DUF2076 domain-containing protein [Komagataeibacter oboediens]MBV0887119.1 DUF2076 domain-containing protein [Komagataeibacter oboediens]MBV1823554.1 DUF2076 domain-containing protein [Komagataeibacter oboediens]MCK9819509.1 DUF2076 domain-containing protein [Komagataeibacter oboediens]PYD83382.1 ABC transporter substrate-binding protein [Komagataeibacter oboediens]WEQ53398.1 DUF2076 domain-containing protein [Komagataeibacter oboediens]
MNDQERQLITQFFARVGGSAPGSVPQTANALPPIDPQADQYIGEMFQKYPEARYRITQTAVVQEAALAEAQNQIRQLQWQLQQAQQQIQQLQQQPSQPSSGGGFLSGMFGGGQQRAQAAPPPGWGAAAPSAPPPQPVYPPGMQPGMFPARGSGFLGSALTTAAGVAGGMMMGNALTGLFSGHHDAGGFASGMPQPGSETVNNYYGDSAAPAAGADPFAGGGTSADSGFDAGGGDDGGGFDGGGFDAGDDNSF